MVIDTQEGEGPDQPVDGLKSAIQGMIVKLKVKVGDNVNEGDVVSVLEAMKMENDVKSDKTGQITQIYINEGDSVEKGDVLNKIE